MTEFKHQSIEDWPYREPLEAYGLCEHGVWAEAYCDKCCAPVGSYATREIEN